MNLRNMYLERESDYDLRYNISALIVCIFRADIKTPEQAFAVIQDIDIPKGETEEWIRLKEAGLSYKEIGEIFGVTDNTVYRRLKRYYQNQERVISK